MLEPKYVALEGMHIFGPDCGCNVDERVDQAVDRIPVATAPHSKRLPALGCNT
jgi:hypothetical protein